MDITITISDKAGEVIRERAEENGKDIEEFVEEFVEKSFETTADENQQNKRKHNLLEFAGMFRSGRTDISERMAELLYEEDFDPAQGFNKR
jgi:hypothetical protein